MMMTPVGFAVAGALTVFAAWAVYLSSVPRGKVPVRPIGTSVFLLAGAGLAVAALVLATRDGEALGPEIIGPASFALMMSSLFFFLLSQRKTPLGKIQVKVDDRLPAFATQTSDGEPFHTDSLVGQRVLINFFRGFW